MFEIVDADGRRTPEHGYNISSPCEPDGSGVLKRLPNFYNFFSASIKTIYN